MLRARKLIKLTVRCGFAGAVTFVMFPRGKSYRPRWRAVTLVAFVVTRPSGGEAKRSIPCRSELGGGWACAEAVGALPAHPRGGSGAGDVAGTGQRNDEGDLFVRRPPVMAGTGDRRMAGVLVHRTG